MLRGVNPENGVVAVHHGSDMCLLHGLSECGEVDFMERALIDIGTCMVAAPFLIVCSEMLHRGNHPLMLHANDVIGSYLGCEVRVFAEILEISSTERCPIDVHARTEKKRDSSRLGVLSEPVTELVGKFAVPCRGSEYPARIERTDGVLTPYIAYSLWTICHEKLRYAETFNGTNHERSEFADVVALFLKRHLRHKVPRTFVNL